MTEEADADDDVEEGEDSKILRWWGKMRRKHNKLKLDELNALWSKMKKKHGQNSNPINHFPTSEEVTEVSKRANK